MAFTRLKLTTFGQTIEAKRHQGKGIHFTRVAIGDGLLGNGSMINRTELVSERHSMLIDGILTTDDAKQSAVVVTLDNSQFEEGFPYRELALMAQDPDTQEEGVYLYDNAGQECEYLDTQDGGVVIYERLKLLIRVEQTEQITFVASGNPLYLSAEDVQEMIRQHNESEDAHPDKADLGEDGKVLPEQLPEMDVSTAMAGFDTMMPWRTRTGSSSRTARRKTPGSGCSGARSRSCRGNCMSRSRGRSTTKPCPRISPSQPQTWGRPQRLTPTHWMPLPGSCRSIREALARAHWRPCWPR